MVYSLGTVSNIAYFKHFYCIGFDRGKVLNGVSDGTRLCDIDKSMEWSPRIVASGVKFYDKLNTSEKELRKDNAIMGFHNELN